MRPRIPPGSRELSIGDRYAATEIHNRAPAIDRRSLCRPSIPQSPPRYRNHAKLAIGHRTWVSQNPGQLSLDHFRAPLHNITLLDMLTGNPYKAEHSLPFFESEEP